MLEGLFLYCFVKVVLYVIFFVLINGVEDGDKKLMCSYLVIKVLYKFYGWDDWFSEDENVSVCRWCVCCLLRNCGVGVFCSWWWNIRFVVI